MVTTHVFGESILANRFLDIYFCPFSFSEKTFQGKNSIFSVL